MTVQIKVTEKLALRYDTIHSVKGQANVPMKMAKGRVKEVHCMYLSGLKKNLLLLSQIAKRHFKVEFDQYKGLKKDKMPLKNSWYKY